MIKKSLIPYLCLFPGVLLASAVILFPLWELTQFATHDVNRFGKIDNFIGWESFAKVIYSSDFRDALMRTGIWTVSVVFGTLLTSLPIAMILNQDFYGKWLARVLIFLPWSISLTMTAILWKWVLHGEFGFLNHTLKQLGLVSDSIFLLSKGSSAFKVEILLGILVSVPFTVIIFLGGLSSIPPDIYDSAKIEGASAFKMLKTITIPLLKPFLSIAVVLNMIYVFNSFPIIWVLTQGGPANETDILVTYLYKQGFRLGKLGEASALSIIMFLILFVFIVIYIRVVEKNER